MSDVGMMFKASNVRALLAGRKTETRRLNTSVKVGDRIYAKETWSPDFAQHYPHDPVWYRADGERDIETRCEGGKKFRAIWSPESKVWVPFKWRPCMFMPPLVARFWAVCTDRREEPLQAITAEAAIAEGIDKVNVVGWPDDVCWKNYLEKEPPEPLFEMPMQVATRTTIAFSDPRKSYASLWDSINQSPFQWNDNPTVQVVVFKRV